MDIVVTTQIVVRREAKADKIIQCDIDSNNKLRESYGIEKLEDLINEQDLVIETRLQAGLASDMIKMYGVEEGKLADTTMVLSERLISDNITTIKFDKSILDFKHRLLGEDNKIIFTELIEQIKGGDIALLYKESGLTEAVIGSTKIEKALADKLDSEKLVSLSTFMVSPSSLRTASMTLAKVAVNGVADDNRWEMMKIATDGAAGEFFTQKAYENMSPKELEKALGRLSQPLAAQQTIGVSENYVIVENFCENDFTRVDKYLVDKNGNKLNIFESKDGLQFIAMEKLINTIEGCYGANLQTRGESLKCSSIDMAHNDLLALYKELKNIGVEIKAYGVNGKMVTPEEFNALDEEAKTTWASRLSLVTDNNARKLKTMKGDNGSLNITALKVAKDIESGLSMVTIMMMLEADSVKANKILRDKLVKTAEKCFGGLGVKIDTDTNGFLENVRIDLGQNLNSSTMVEEHMIGVDPDLMFEAIPMSISGSLHNAITSISNMVNDMKLDCEALYSVVQSDFAAMFNALVLAENECYNSNFEPGQKVAASRHPISGLLAVTTFTNVGIKEIRVRILALNVSDSIKRLLLSMYNKVNGYTVIPASKFLMEKHDGMDFDIDAMVIYLDAEIVELLEKITNGGVMVVRTDADFEKLADEEAIEEAQRKTWMTFESHKKQFPTGTKAEEKTVSATMGTTKAGFLKKAKKKNAIERMTSARGLVEVSIFNDIANSFYNYIASGIASVGAVVSSYYNNQCILEFLKNTTDEVMKKKVVRIFKEYYACECKKAYATPFKKIYDDLQKKLTVVVKKEDCIEAVIGYKNSYGTEEDLIAYLEDCCIGNRFPAETAIDAAKNFFIVLNYFKHEQVLKALGSDKNMKVVLEENDKTFKETVEDEDYQDQYGIKGNEINVFNVKFLKAVIKNGYLLKPEMTKKEMIEAGRIDQSVPCIMDKLGQIKMELIDMANIIIAIVAVKLEQKAFSEDAIKLRNKIRLELTKHSKVTVAVNAVGLVNSTAMTITDELKKAVEIKGDGENMAAKEFEKTVIVPSLKNLVTMTSCKMVQGEFQNDFDQKDIGLAVLKNMLRNVSDIDSGSNNGKKPYGNNSTMLKVFEEELIIALEYLNNNEIIKCDNADKMRYDWEQIKEVKDERNKPVSLDQFAGVDVADGLVENFEVIAYNKRAKLNGMIAEIDGKYFVMNERQFIKADPTKGIALKVVDKNAKQTKNHIIAATSLITGKAPEMATSIATVPHADGRMLISMGINEKKFSMFELEAAPKKIRENLGKMEFDVNDVTFLGSPDMKAKEDSEGNITNQMEINKGIVILRGANIASLLGSMPDLKTVEEVKAKVITPMDMTEIDFTEIDEEGNAPTESTSIDFGMPLV